MLYVFDSNIIINEGLTTAEFFSLLANRVCTRNNTSYERAISKCVEKKLCKYTQVGILTPTELGIEFLNQIYAESKAHLNVEDESALTELSKQMREVFPKGIKDGTSSPWRESVPLLKKRLKKFIGLFGEEYSDPNKILQATKEYVEAFNGNYAYMRTLKYFILKDEVKVNEEGRRYVEQTSDLANCIANLGENSVQNFEIGTLVT